MLVSVLVLGFLAFQQSLWSLGVCVVEGEYCVSKVLRVEVERSRVF